MPLPPWVSPTGLLGHLLVGAVLTLLLHLNFLAVLAVAVAHEVGDSDLKRGTPGWPWNGLLDVAAFLPVPLLAAIL